MTRAEAARVDEMRFGLLVIGVLITRAPTRDHLADSTPGSCDISGYRVVVIERHTNKSCLAALGTAGHHVIIADATSELSAHVTARKDAIAFSPTGVSAEAFATADLASPTSSRGASVSAPTGGP
jgi:hypothetical protein